MGLLLGWVANDALAQQATQPALQISNALAGTVKPPVQQSVPPYQLCNKRAKRLLLKPGRQTFHIDTVSIVPFSLQITDQSGKLMDTAYYAVDEANALVTQPEKMSRHGAGSLEVIDRNG